MIVVLVAEKNEIDLVPLAYKNCPIFVTGIGAGVFSILKILEGSLGMIDKIVNAGYCGACSPIPTGTKVRIGEDHSCYSFDDFVTSPEELSEKFRKNADVVDMEYEIIQEFADKHNIPLVCVKTVSDHLNYEQYKEAYAGKKKG